MPDWWLVMGWAIFPGIVGEKTSASYNNLPYNSCSLSLPPCPTSQKIWMLSQSFTSSPRCNLVGSGEVTQPDGALATLSPSSLCWAHPGRFVRRWRLTSDSDGEGSVRSHPPFCLCSLPGTSTPCLRVAGGRVEGSLSLSVSPEQCCAF